MRGGDVLCVNEVMVIVTGKKIKEMAIYTGAQQNFHKQKSKHEARVDG